MKANTCSPHQLPARQDATQIIENGADKYKGLETRRGGLCFYFKASSSEGHHLTGIQTEN
jgi:hypothetical protein